MSGMGPSSFNMNAISGNGSVAAYDTIFLSSPRADDVATDPFLEGSRSLPLQSLGEMAVHMGVAAALSCRNEVELLQEL